MRRFLIYITIGALTTFGAYAKAPVAKGNTNSELGTFVIEKSVAPLIIGWKILDTYDVRYENSCMRVRIAVDDSDKKYRKYIVVSDDLCIQYTCNGKIFGTSLIDHKYVRQGVTKSVEYLNMEEFFHQKVISSTVKTELEQLKLISVYFPRLVNKYQKVFAVK